MKKLMLIGACALLAATAAAESQAATHAPGFYFVQSCGVLNPQQCPVGPAPIWYGPFATMADCNTKLVQAWQSGFVQPPYALSNCFQWPGG